MPMLRCVGCDKPVLLMSDEQAEQVASDPERFEYACVGCPEPPC